MITKWTAERMPDVIGKTVLITGGNSGIGFEAAKALAARGAEIILAVRNEAKGKEAKKRIKADNGNAKVTIMSLDLSDLSSIRHFANQFLQQYSSLDLLINNAGVMVPPHSKTKDGFELQFGCNHLGHFALTGLLLPLLMATPHSRVVTVSSIAANSGEIYFDNLDGEKGYSPMKFYRQSKLANLLFAKELQNRLEAAGSTTISAAVHPGISNTNLLSRGSGKEPNGLLKFLVKLFSQSAEMGALPTLYAATESIEGGTYIGPDGKDAKKGYPVKDRMGDVLFKPDVAEKLWSISEELTKVTYIFKKR
ncbi:short-chain dehydrogenase [Priestia megaterium]|uniref:oxidoreductase n=1 Tax=Priestia megaterium TaxID=1404 RepID=UPI000BF7FF65|nr:oxidoreductase [Priestia megaterium]PEZ12145.1 short-chain dehydrogenase [Priestia megaterium]